MNRNCGDWESAIHYRGVAFQLRRISEQNDLNRFAFLMQASCRDESIAAIVALTTEDDNAPHRAVMREHVIGDRSAGVLHQRERGNAEALAGRTIDGAHLFSGDNFHAIPLLQHRCSLLTVKQNGPPRCAEGAASLLTPHCKTKRPSALCGGPQNRRARSGFRLPARGQRLYPAVLLAVSEVHHQSNRQPAEKPDPVPHS